MDYTDRIDVVLRIVWQKIARYYNNEAQKHGFTMSTAHLLLLIDKEGSPSSSLAPMIGMEASSLTRTLKNMEENGFIERKPDSNDKRLSRVFLTPKGITHRKIAKQKVMEFNELVYDKIPKSKLDSLVNIMHKIESIVDQEVLNSQTSKKDK